MFVGPRHSYCGLLHLSDALCGRFCRPFQYKRDAEDFDRTLTHRMEKFGLQLAPDKTRMMLFGRFAHERAASYGGKPGTFEFLGFKHVCGVDAKGKFAVIRIPAEKSCRKFLDSTHAWLQSIATGDGAINNDTSPCSSRDSTNTLRSTDVCPSSNG